MTGPRNIVQFIFAIIAMIIGAAAFMTGLQTLSQSKIANDKVYSAAKMIDDQKQQIDKLEKTIGSLASSQQIQMDALERKWDPLAQSIDKNDGLIEGLSKNPDEMRKAIDDAKFRIEV